MIDPRRVIVTAVQYPTPIVVERVYRHRRNLLFDERGRVRAGAVNPRAGEGGVYLLGQSGGEVNQLLARNVVESLRGADAETVNIDHRAVFRDLLFPDRPGHH